MRFAPLSSTLPKIETRRVLLLSKSRSASSALPSPPLVVALIVIEEPPMLFEASKRMRLEYERRTAPGGPYKRPSRRSQKAEASAWMERPPFCLPACVESGATEHRRRRKATPSAGLQ